MNRIEGGSFDADELFTAHSEGREAREVVSQVTTQGEGIRTDLNEAYDRYARATGDYQTAEKYKAKLEKCKSDGEILSFREKAEIASAKWVKKQLNDIYLGSEIDSRETPRLQTIIKGAVKTFEGLSLNSGSYNKMTFIEHFDESQLPQIEFRNKLRKKCRSKVFREAYFNRLGIEMMSPFAKESEFFAKIEKELGAMADEPMAVKEEYDSRILKGDKTPLDKLHKEVRHAYDKIEKPYIEQVLANADAWGGPMVDSPHGKIRKSAADYIKWLQGKDSIAEMRVGLDALPDEIARRRGLFKRRDELIAHLEPKEANRIKTRTDEMRSTVLDVYLPRLKQHVKENSIELAAYDAELVGAEQKNISLFSVDEIAQRTKRFKSANPERQKAMQLILEDDIAERKEVIDDYFALPDYMKDNIQFYGLRSHAERTRMVKALQRRLEEEPESPFDIDKVKNTTLDTKDVSDIADTLQSFAGREAFQKKVLEDLKHEGELKISEKINEFGKKAGASLKRQDEMGITQVQSKQVDNNIYGETSIRMVDASNASNATDRIKGNSQAALAEAWKLGYTWDANARETKELGRVTLSQLETGSGDLDAEMSKMEWPEDVQIQDENGNDVRNPLMHIGQIQANETRRVRNLAKTKLLRNELGASEQNMAMLRNSSQIDEALDQLLIDSIMAPAANNNRYYQTEMAA